VSGLLRQATANPFQFGDARIDEIVVVVRREILDDDPALEREGSGVADVIDWLRRRPKK
jgi:hypothetical protein